MEKDNRIFVMSELRERAARPVKTAPVVDTETAETQAHWLACADAALQGSHLGKPQLSIARHKGAGNKRRTPRPESKIA
jgi:hypothetical protein